MNKVKVKVVDAIVLELTLDNWLDALWVVETVPQFADNEKVFTLDETVFDGTVDTLA